MRLLLIILLFLLSCTKDDVKRIYKEKFITCKANNKLLQFNQIIIIPSEGCTGCITETTNFFIDNIHKLEKTSIIYTKIDDYKIFKLKLPSKYLNYKNVIIDKEGLFDDARISTIYPKLLTLENGEIISIENFDSTLIK